MRYWTDKEEEYIKNNIFIKTVNEMSLFLNRSYDIVLRKKNFILNTCEDFKNENIERIKSSLIEYYVSLCEEIGRFPGQKDIVQKRKENPVFPTYEKFHSYFGSLFNLYLASGLEGKYNKARYNLKEWYSIMYPYSGKSGIYKIENILNKRVYIGQGVDLYVRLRNGYFNKLPINKCHSLLLQRDWNVYGEEYFAFTIQEICDIEELDVRETYWIQYYKSYDEQFGYNVVDFGKGSNKRYLSPEQIEKLRIMATGEKNKMFGKTHTPESRKIISENSKRKVYQFKIDGTFVKEYDSTISASLETGIAKHIISQSKNGKVGLGKTGFTWISEEDFLSEKIIEIIEERINNHNLKRVRVVQLDEYRNIINIFDSVTEAKRATGANNISDGIKHGWKSKGFFWEKV